MIRRISCLLSCVMTFGVMQLSAQQNTLSAGGDATGSGGEATYSVGQTYYTTTIGSGGEMNEGLQQPYEFYTVGIEEEDGISLNMIVFPNPTDSEVNLRVDMEGLEEPGYQLLDMNGRLLVSERITTRDTSIPMGNLSEATYILKVYHRSGELKSFLIIKN